MAEIKGREFRWKNGKIYDGTSEIARFNIKNMSFSGIKFNPGGKVLINEWTLYWWSKANEFKTVLNDEFLVEDSNPDRLKMHIISYSKNKHHVTKTGISLLYDRNLMSYVYEVRTELRTNRAQNEQKYLWRPPRDFAKIVFNEDRNLYGEYIYQARAGNWIKVPLNYLLTPDKFDISFKRGKTITALWSPTGDDVPVIELKKLTPWNDCCGYIITWPSLGIYLRKERETIRPWGKLNDPASYRIYRCDKGRFKNIRPASETERYGEEDMEEYDRPRFEAGKVNDFEKSVGLDNGARNSYWTFAGDVGLTGWCRHVGYRGKSSLRCGHQDKVVNCWWEIAPPDKGPQLHANKNYILSAYVKTEGLMGEGAYISCIPDKGGEIITSDKINGSNEWQKLSVAIPAANTSRRARIQLHHKGKGISYFDRVKL